MSYLEVRHLSKRYGRTNGVLDVSFDVDTGTVFGLAGPNGAGKSSLTRMLATLVRPTKGQITIDGLDAMRKARTVRGWIGYVPDVFGLYERTKVGEYLNFFGRCFGMPWRIRQSAIVELLKLVDLYDFRFADCQSLSRGQQQKLLIARALLNEPRLLVLDEPLTALDSQSRLEMLEVLRELASMGKAIVMSSNAIGDLVDVCDRIGLMAAGQLTAVGTVPELVRELEVAHRMRLVVLQDADVALRVLNESSDVTEVEASRNWFSFTCHGGQAGQAQLLTQLIAAGVKVAQYAPMQQPLHELVASAPPTPVSPDQSRP